MSGFPTKRPKLSKYKRDGRMHVKIHPTGLGIGQKLVKA
jgi:hypothetical protein